jgi:hypothetical protein
MAGSIPRELTARMHSRKRKALTLVFLGWGIYSVFMMKRDFQHTTRLTIFLLALVPMFLLLHLVGRVVTRHELRGHTSPRLKAVNWLSQSITQNMTQYILMFSLPFFIVNQRWVYLVATLFLLATTLWETWWKTLFPHTIYRQLLRLWSILCAGSFLYPFVWPGHLAHFYWALAAGAALALFPTRIDRNHLLSSALLLALTLLNLLLLPPALRFPLLSVWVSKPRFATNEDQKDTGVEKLPREMKATAFRDTLRSGSTICCVAPVVAPPGVRERVIQEWTLEGELLEKPQLKSYIRGNANQRGFHSFFCKRNFPPVRAGQILRCRISLQETIFLGEMSLTLQ